MSSDCNYSPEEGIETSSKNDNVEFFINSKHEFDPEVVEFFSTIEYLGGRKTLNFIRGPMFYKQGKGFKRLINDKFKIDGE